MWIVVSIPLWVLGIFGLWTALFAMWRVATRPDHPGDYSLMRTAFCLLPVSSAILYIAARIAS